MAFALRRILSPTLQRQLIAATTTRYVQPAAAGGSNLMCYSTNKEPAAVADPNPKTTLPAAEQKLVVSASCIKRLREICNDGSFLRLTVEGGGCSGFQYKFDLDTKLNEDDRQFGEDKAKVVIDEVSLEYCAGATVDYHTELIRAGFKILANPQAEQGCSCGASFAIKLD